MIAHFDADAFFASVEQAADARLRGRPVAVSGGERGVVCAASYEARAFGIRSAMPTRLALQRCPQLCLVRGRFELYEQFSNHIFGLCEDLTPHVERCSVDEGYLDLRPHGGGPQGAAERMRWMAAEVERWLRVSISCGLAARKRVAQIASKLNKPRGFTVVPAGAEAAFLAPLEHGRLPGLGPVAVARLNGIGLRTVGDLLACPTELLYPLLGRQTADILDMARGIDNSTVEREAAPARSYGGQHAFGADIGDEETVRLKLLELLAAQLVRLRAAGLAARTLTVYLRYSDFESAQSSVSRDEPANVDSAFIPLLDLLRRRLWQRRVCLNQVRVQLSNLYPAWMQGELFAPQPAALSRLYQARDAVNARFGQGALRAASLLGQ